ncbi:zinc-dependent metalloprotease [Rubrobacter marinus]|uniref:zinc-dependent metalloprotease n=1 Tax=Rubrobacter marinus TaxID=2653852 RepID=UPI00140A35DA|nr:zinc-dependent metalloprotease [Rubrobacter marinus]
MISWGIARSIAVTLASRTEGPIPAKHGAFDYPAVVEESLDPLEGFTGISLGRDARPIRVASRAEWIDFNISAFGALLEPILERASKSTGNEMTWAFGAATLTAQMGLLLGFLSARVLGQYDTGPLVAGNKSSLKRPGEPGEVFFLDGNIVAAAGRLGVPVDGLRRYIVLHETTHALQFEGHPWLRDHLGGLVEGFTGPLAEKLGVLETVRRMTENLRTGARSLELVMTGGQRRAFDEMQATMSVIEGYSDYVMHHVGSRVVPGYEDLTRKMSRSRMHRPPLETAIFRITGLDMKLEQYRMGEEFADAVARRVGMRGLNRVWDGPESMPSLAEIRDPGLWMDRVIRAA